MILAIGQLSETAEDYVVAGLTLAAFLVAILIVRVLWRTVVAPIINRTRTELDDTVLVPLRSLLSWGLLLIGLYYALIGLQSVQDSKVATSIVTKGHGILWVLLLIWSAVRLTNRMTAWYVCRAQEKEPTNARDVVNRAGILRKTIDFVLLVLGLLYILKVSGVDISPLLAGGAIGGLAIALALQDTLSNLFAGFYLMIDKPVSVGDYIKLESSEEGFVEEIGWRNTKVRLWANNVVVIPNSKLSQSVILNYFLPEQELSVYVWCGVAYDSDLQHVEDVTIEVAKQVMDQTEGAAPDWEPVVRWKEFADFAITFVVVMRVKDFSAQYKMSSDFIKALHKRFEQEGIEIPFPIRTVIMKPGHPPAPEMGGRASPNT